MARRASALLQKAEKVSASAHEAAHRHRPSTRAATSVRPSVGETERACRSRRATFSGLTERTATQCPMPVWPAGCRARGSGPRSQGGAAASEAGRAAQGPAPASTAAAEIPRREIAGRQGSAAGSAETEAGPQGQASGPPPSTQGQAGAGASAPRAQTQDPGAGPASACAQAEASGASPPPACACFQAPRSFPEGTPSRSCGAFVPQAEPEACVLRRGG